MKLEKIQLAYDSANKAVEQAPDSAAAHAALGEVYFRQAKMAESEREFLKGINSPHPDARAYFGLEGLYDAYSLHARARKMLERAHTLDPDDPEIQREWMYTLTRAERIKWLENYLSTASLDDRESSGFHTYLDLLKEREKRPDLKCRVVNKLASTETRLKPLLIDASHMHGFGLEVKFNGQSSRLLLDTGAGGILINRRLAEKAGIEPLVKGQISGIGDKGDVRSYWGYAKSIKIGELEFQNCPVEVSEKRSVVDDDGLIGSNVFDDYLVTIDFLWQKLKLEELPKRPGEAETQPALASKDEDANDEDDNQTSSSAASGSTAQTGQQPDGKAIAKESKVASRRGPQDRYIAPEMQSFTKIYRFGHMLLIPTRVGESTDKLFLIDTGAMFNSISPDAARTVTKVRRDDYVAVKGVSGSVKDVYSADKATLQFSHFRQENQDLTSFDLSGISKDIGTELSGILGFTTLRLFTLKIDYRDGLVDFVYTAGPNK